MQEIGKDIVSETDRLKIMIYDKYLDRCRVGDEETERRRWQVESQFDENREKMLKVANVCV